MEVDVQEILEVVRKKRPKKRRKKTSKLDLTGLLSLCKGFAMTDPVYLKQTKKKE